MEHTRFYKKDHQLRETDSSVEACVYCHVTSNCASAQNTAFFLEYCCAPSLDKNIQNNRFVSLWPLNSSFVNVFLSQLWIMFSDNFLKGDQDPFITDKVTLYRVYCWPELRLQRQSIRRKTCHFYAFYAYFTIYPLGHHTGSTLGISVPSYTMLFHICMHFYANA